MPNMPVDLSAIHDCPKCHDKTVFIAVDNLGNTYCGYCGERVDYSKAFKDGTTTA